MIIHEEKAPFSRLMKLLMLALVVYVVGIMLLAMSIEEPPPEVVYIIFPVLTAVFLWAYASFFSMKFSVTDSAVVASMWPFRSRVGFKEIESIEVVQKLPWWLGWGLRMWYRRGAMQAFVSQRKPSLLIHKKKGRIKKILLTTQDPEEFKKKVEEAMKS